MYYKLNTFIIGRMRKTIEDSGIKVDWDPCGKYLCCSETKSFKLIETESEELDQMKVHYEIYEGEELAKRIGTRYYKKALYTPGTLLVNPADVLRGLYTTLPENVDVFEECPVMRIEEGTRARVTLLNGKEITAKTVIVTGGPFIEEFGIVKRVFCPVLSYGAFTRQLNDKEMKYFEGVKPWGCTAGHPAGTTVRFTTDNRLYVRNGFSYATHLTTSHQRIRRAVPKLRRAFENRFPEIKHVNFEFIYGGMINMTMNFRPLMTQKHPSVYASASGEGAGVAKTCLMGHYIAEWINGIDSEELRFLRRIATPSHIPPEPLTTIGATARYDGVELGTVHLLSSYAAVNYPEYAYDYARLGILMFGVKSSPADYLREDLQPMPVMTLKARITSVREIGPGETVSYGRIFRAERPTKVASVSIGYADGIPRCLSGGKLRAIVRGQYAQGIGRICMDQLMLDVTGIEDVRVGDEAVFIGRQGDCVIYAEELAENAGTITNELFSRLGARVEGRCFRQEA